MKRMAFAFFYGFAFGGAGYVIAERMFRAFFRKEKQLGGHDELEQ